MSNEKLQLSYASCNFIVIDKYQDCDINEKDRKRTMRTKIFAYKGVLGIESSDRADGLMNNPNEKGQMGFVLDSRFVDIQPEALDLLKRIERSDDDCSELDIFETDRNVIVIAWLGGPMRAFYPEKTTGGISYSPDLIEKTIKFKTPQRFKEFVDDGRKNEKPKSKRNRKKR